MASRDPGCTRHRTDDLERAGVISHLKEATALLLENRPDDPIEFMTEYFRAVVDGSSHLMNSYRHIRMTSHNTATFIDNLLIAYDELESEKGAAVEDFHRILRSLCHDFPHDQLHAILSILQLHHSDAFGNLGRITFKQFAAGVKACLVYGDFLLEARRWFLALHVQTETTTSGDATGAPAASAVVGSAASSSAPEIVSAGAGVGPALHAGGGTRGGILCSKRTTATMPATTCWPSPSVGIELRKVLAALRADQMDQNAPQPHLESGGSSSSSITAASIIETPSETGAKAFTVTACHGLCAALEDLAVRRRLGTTRSGQKKHRCLRSPLKGDSPDDSHSQCISFADLTLCVFQLCAVDAER